ncbi:hypothetical protein [Kitasatospora cineracea]|uniref:hypothetical protein n=1 Tax=Kitasatospora cineracea TaxID=88074 RepID=UPI0037F41FA6
MSTTDEHPVPPAEQQAGHGASTEVRELQETRATPLLGLRALLRDAADRPAVGSPGTAESAGARRVDETRAPGTGEEAVVLVGGAGSRAEVAPDGSTARAWGSRARWAQAEAVHARWAEAEAVRARWTAADRPAVYGVEFGGGRTRVGGGAALSRELPVS